MVNHHGAHLITRLRKYQTEIFASARTGISANLLICNSLHRPISAFTISRGGADEAKPFRG